MSDMVNHLDHKKKKKNPELVTSSFTIIKFSFPNVIWFKKRKRKKKRFEFGHTCGVLRQTYPSTYLKRRQLVLKLFIKKLFFFNLLI